MNTTITLIRYYKTPNGFISLTSLDAGKRVVLQEYTSRKDTKLLLNSESIWTNEAKGVKAFDILVSFIRNKNEQ